MNIRASKGFSLLEVLIAVVILSIGLLAIASLQGRLLRNTSDTNARTIAMNIGQGLLDRFRSVLSVAPDPATADATSASGDFDYDDIIAGDLSDLSILGGDGSSTTVTRGNTIFTPTWSVVDCWDNGATFACGAAPDDSPPDFKKVNVQIAWNDEEGVGQSVTLEEIIAQVAPGDSGILLDDIDLGGGKPTVSYTPQPAPEVVKIPVDLGSGRFKETTEPAPDILRNDFSTLTTFSTITFDQDSNDFLAQRQEDFLVVNCRCTLQSGEIEGREPMVWNGNEYVEAEIFDADGNLVTNSKPWGAPSASVSNQPDLCTSCCNNHHDSDDSVELYDPFRQATRMEGDTELANYNAAGDHKHFLSSVDADQGQVLTEAANAGDEYDEVCRFVRVDGLFELGQDFQLAGFNVLPQSQLEDSSKLTAYQNYVVDLATDYLDEIGTDCGGQAGTNCYPGVLPDTTDALVFTQAAIDDVLEETMVTLASLATATPNGDTRPRLGTYDTDGDGELSDDELASFHEEFGLNPWLARGVYIDYINNYKGFGGTSLRECIDFRREAETPGDDTPAYCLPEAGGVLDIVPFYEVNITGLAFWKVVGGDYLILYQGIADGIEQVYRRGDVRLETETNENADVFASIDFSNSGLTDTLGIDQADSADELSATALIDGVTEAEQVVEVLINLSIDNNVRNVLPANVVAQGLGLFTVNPGDQQRTRIDGAEVDCSIKEAESVLKCTFDPALLATDNLALGFSLTGYVRDPDADGTYDDNFACASVDTTLRTGESAIDVLGTSVTNSNLTTESTSVFVGGAGGSDNPNTFPHCDSDPDTVAIGDCPESLVFALNASIKRTGSCSN